MQEAVRQQRQQVEDYLTSQLAAIPSTVGLPGDSFRLLRAAASVPQPGMLDLVRLALPTGAATAAQLNPFLSSAAAATLQAAARTWLQLCVLEDRLGRLERLASDPAALPLLIQVRPPTLTFDLLRLQSSQRTAGRRAAVLLACLPGIRHGRRALLTHSCLAVGGEAAMCKLEAAQHYSVRTARGACSVKAP